MVPLRYAILGRECIPNHTWQDVDSMQLKREELVACRCLVRVPLTCYKLRILIERWFEVLREFIMGHTSVVW